MKCVICGSEETKFKKANNLTVLECLICGSEFDNTGKILFDARKYSLVIFYPLK